MPFWVGDYTKDTMHLNTIQHGAYLLLIFHLWTSNDPSDAPSNQQVIAKALLKHCPSICKMSKSEWDEIKDDILPFFIIDGDYIISKRVSEQLTESNSKNINAKERARKAAEKRWGKNEDAPSNATSIQQAINEQCSHNANQSQSQTFNNSSNYINEEDALFLARAQEIDNYQNHEIEGETPEQRKDLDEAYDAICQGEENQKTQYNFEPSKLRNAPKSMQEVEEAYKSIVKIGESKGAKSNTSLEFWYKHWEFKNWTDDNKKPIDWKSKLSYNAFEPFFDKKEEKEPNQQTQKTPQKTFKQLDAEDEELKFLKLEFGFYQYKDFTIEQMREVKRNATKIEPYDPSKEVKQAQQEAPKQIQQAQEVVQIAPVKIKTQADIDADYLHELRRDYGGSFANANKTLEEMLEIKRKKEEEKNKPMAWHKTIETPQTPITTLDASLRDLYGNLLHNY